MAEDIPPSFLYFFLRSKTEDLQRELRHIKGLSASVTWMVRINGLIGLVEDIVGNAPHLCSV